eukprot:CFRG5289T1
MLALVDWTRTCVVVALEMIVGDVVCQRLENDEDVKKNVTNGDTEQMLVPSHDTRRTVALAITGGAITGPLVHAMVASNERMLPGNSVRSVICKAFINLLWSPLLIGGTLGGSMLLRGKSVEEAKTKLQLDLWPTTMTGFAFWPPVNILQYAFVPLKWRASAGACAGGVWSTYLSYQATKIKDSSMSDSSLQVEKSEQGDRVASLRRKSSADKLVSGIHNSPLHRQFSTGVTTVHAATFEDKTEFRSNS